CLHWSCDVSQIHIPSIFFFSSRRRHTRWPRDWSSDVCSSDLPVSPNNVGRLALAVGVLAVFIVADLGKPAGAPLVALVAIVLLRSEERRVGKECRSGWAVDQEKVEGRGVWEQTGWISEHGRSA